MLNYILPALIGTALGFLAGIGVGGGSLLLLWLTQVASMPQPQAKILNLLFYLPAALISTIFRRKQQCLRKDIVLPALLTGSFSSICFSILAIHCDVKFMKKGLGAILIATGLREIFYRPRNAK
jgi:uncharacterized membrane protein YfcA